MRRPPESAHGPQGSASPDLARERIDSLWEDALNTLLIQRHGPHADLVLNQPQRRNAMSLRMWRGLARALEELQADASVRLLVLRGAGGTFSAGADLSEFETHYASPEGALAANAAIAGGLAAMDNLAKPSIAVIQGACMGGGCALAAACDLQLADSSAVFGIDPTALGMTYRFRDCQRLAARIGLARTKRLLLGGERIDAATALDWGLIAEVAAPEALDEALQRRVRAVLRRSPEALAALKKTLNAIDQGAGAESPQLKALFEAGFQGQDFREGTTAFLEKRPPEFG